MYSKQQLNQMSVANEQVVSCQLYSICFKIVTIRGTALTSPNWDPLFTKDKLHVKCVSEHLKAVQAK